jgi:uncharacterized protein YbaP (TraB family)
VGRAAALILALALAAGAPGSAAGAEKFAQGLLWRVSKAGVPPSHVFGTIHLADPRALEIPEPVRDALAASRSYFMETPIWEGHGARMHEAQQYDDGRRLRAQLDAGTFARVREALLARGIPEAVIERLKPWAALANLTVTPADYESETLDQRLFAAARARRMGIQALEGTEEHIAVFDGIPLATQLAMLRHTLEQRDWLVGMIEPTLQAWLKRDLAGIRRVNERVASRSPGMAPHYEVFFRHLVDHRSIVMAHRLYVPLRSGRAFVAVGAAHLYGRSGLLALIEKQGYRVQRVY